jgi:hypothetical protein
MMTTFKPDDLVVQTGMSDVMRVLDVVSDEDGEQQTVMVSIGNDDASDWFRADELSYIPAVSQYEGVAKPMERVVPVRTAEVIHQDICDMFAQIVNYMTERLNGEAVELRIDTEAGGSRTTCDVKFGARIRYDNWVETDDLYTSARIACNRYLENEAMAPRRISLHKEAAE